MPDVPIRAGLTIPEAELALRFSPSGGPGGQHANRSNTRVELVWEVDSSAVLDDDLRRRITDKLGPVVRIVVDDERSQSRNRDLAHERLRVRVQAALHRPKARRKTKPSRSSQRKRVAGKRQRSQLKAQRRRPGSDD
jgi:ribosome-associated protein